MNVCPSCGFRYGSHAVDCIGQRNERRRQLQADCDHREEYGAKRTIADPPGPLCCARCGKELPMVTPNRSGSDYDDAVAFARALQRSLAEEHVTRTCPDAKSVERENLIQVWMDGFARAQDTATTLINHELDRLRATLANWSGRPRISEENAVFVLRAALRLANEKLKELGYDPFEVPLR